MRNALFVFLNMLLILIFLSCITVLNINKHHVVLRKDETTWTSAVFLIIAEDSYYKEHCDNDSFCTENESERYESNGTGSGFAVKVDNQDENTTYIMTAAHICSTEMAPPEDFDRETMVIFRKLYVSNGDHNIKISAIVVKEDIENDLCVLKIEQKLPYVFKISHKEPEYAEKVYNIGAPLGFFGPTYKPFSEGFFSGHVPRYSHYTKKHYVEALYHIAAVGGMSGSPIINNKGHVVGMIQSVNMQYPFLSFSSTVHDMHVILEDL